MAKVRREAAESARNGLSVGPVIKTVEHALMARPPRPRSFVRRDSWFWRLPNLLPDRWSDGLILRTLSE
jgi:hypothetical protein